MFNIKSKTILIVILMLAITLFIVNPKICMEATLQGMRVWGLNVVPALFPFFILTRIIIMLNQTSIPVLDKFTTKFFNTSNAGLVYFLSMISGYPVGAKMISGYYQSGAISKATATKMFSFCSTSGPMFIIGTVGIGVFADVKVGYVLLIGHIIGGFLNGLLYRGKTIPQNQFKRTINKSSLNDIMYDSITSILMVGGYIVFSSVNIELLTLSNILPALTQLICNITSVDYSVVYSLLCGLIEITNGLIMLGKTSTNIQLKIILSSAIIAFSGLCIMLQSNAFLESININKFSIVVQKLTQTIFSVLVTVLLVLIVY